MPSHRDAGDPSLRSLRRRFPPGDSLRHLAREAFHTTAPPSALAPSHAVVHLPTAHAVAGYRTKNAAAADVGDSRNPPRPPCSRCPLCRIISVSPPSRASMRQRFLQALQRDAEGVEGEVRGVCNAMLFVYAHNNNEIKVGYKVWNLFRSKLASAEGYRGLLFSDIFLFRESSTSATGKLAAHTHFIES
uniref:Uncharacterized protein n=1 Tax=Oryza barthii TaxID=65489 RepID=A0A0D3HCQ0_9ORYZ